MYNINIMCEVIMIEDGQQRNRFSKMFYFLHSPPLRARAIHNETHNTSKISLRTVPHQRIILLYHPGPRTTGQHLLIRTPSTNENRVFVTVDQSQTRILTPTQPYTLQ